MREHPQQQQYGHAPLHRGAASREVPAGLSQGQPPKRQRRLSGELPQPPHQVTSSRSDPSHRHQRRREMQPGQSLPASEFGLQSQPEEQHLRGSDPQSHGVARSEARAVPPSRHQPYVQQSLQRQVPPQGSSSEAAEDSMSEISSQENEPLLADPQSQPARSNSLQQAHQQDMQQQQQQPQQQEQPQQQQQPQQHMQDRATFAAARARAAALRSEGVEASAAAAAAAAAAASVGAARARAAHAGPSAPSGACTAASRSGCGEASAAAAAARAVAAGRGLTLERGVAPCRFVFESRVGGRRLLPLA